jgi:uncharacterized protein
VTALLVLAKEPLPGRSKTRLCPPLRLEEAAEVAEAALVTTLETVSAARADRRILVLDGAPGQWLFPGIGVIPQRGGDQAERLAHAFEDAGAPALLIGMDSPQVTPAMLDRATGLLAQPGTDAVLGPAEDGGWWALGLCRADPRVFRGVAMSRSDTGRNQLERLRRLGLRTRLLETLRDVDHFADAVAVARSAPGTPFGRTIERLADAAHAVAG